MQVGGVGCVASSVVATAVVAGEGVPVVTVPDVVSGLAGVVAALVDSETSIDVVSEFPEGLGEASC